jgi:hypothetical protein
VCAVTRLSWPHPKSGQQDGDRQKPTHYVYPLCSTALDSTQASTRNCFALQHSFGQAALTLAGHSGPDTVAYRGLPQQITWH